MPLVTISAEHPAYGGLTIGTLEGKVVMIKGTIPGERVEARIEEEKSDYCKAAAVTIVEPSPDRVAPSCPYFGVCGGCQLQHISYKRQVLIKEEVLRGTLRRIAGMDPLFAPPLIHEPPWHYRLRGQFKAAGGKLGFYKERTREVVDIESCPLMHETINAQLGTARRLLGSFDFKEIHLSSGGGDSGVTALLKGMSGSPRDAGQAGAALLGAGLSGACIEIGKKRTLCVGEPRITLDLLGLGYAISPQSFFQSHWELNREVVRYIRERLSPLRGKRILDLYSGAGNFSLPLAGEAEAVIALEENPSAVQDGERNKERNRIRNYRFVTSPAEQLAVKERIDILITDPPRLGLSNRAVERVLALMPGCIVYISCNPATLARDLKKLAARYDVESVRMIDFFPQTYHIESLAILRLR
ncbi:MAG: class I SAM-dependent RNA methyltransferase [Nitrospirota bacterium]